MKKFELKLEKFYEDYKKSQNKLKALIDLTLTSDLEDVKCNIEMTEPKPKETVKPKVIDLNRKKDDNALF